jgi:hypothetical protein
MKIGRNDSCPCGSGIKYKKCCADKEQTREKPAGMAATMDEIRKQLAGQNFASLEEASTFISQHMRQKNQAVIEDFHGLSSEHMYRFLHFPFETPHFVSFPSSLDISPKAPIATLFQLLADAIGDGLKPTATGNLPRQVCRDVALAFWGEDKYRYQTRHGELQSETDFIDLHVTRLVAELAGLIRKYKGKFILGKDCRKLMAESGLAGVYPRLFRSFAVEYNWAFRDRFVEIPMVQQSFLFTIYLLKKYGGEWRSNKFYEDCFLQAFPMLLQEVPPMGEYYSPEKVLRSCYSLRCMEYFAEFLGLAEIERNPADRYADGFRIKSLPLLDHTVKFHL